jgi:hypothetical protein
MCSSTRLQKEMPQSQPAPFSIASKAAAAFYTVDESDMHAQNQQVAA